MNCNTFTSALEETLRESQEIRGTHAVLTMHCKGEKATPGDTKAESFIREVNMKYFRIECDALLGDFAVFDIGNEEEHGKGSVLLKAASLKKVYEEKGWDAVISIAVENIRYAQYIKNSAGELTDSLFSYEKVKDRLIIRPLNLKNNRTKLEGCVYRVFEDIALVLYAIVLDDRENGILNTIKVPFTVFEEWGIDFDELLKITMNNTGTYALPRLYTNIFDIEHTPEHESAFMAKDFKTRRLKPDNVALVTTNRKTNGAIAMFYPGVKEKLAEMFDDSFYVAFTSIHEAMIHKKGSIDPTSIKRNVTETNRIFGPDDTLSDKVFFFDRKSGSFAAVV